MSSSTVGKSLKKPFGEATFSKIRNARLLGWCDAFEVEFEDGLCFREDHAVIRKANQIPETAQPTEVVVDPELASHFIITYDEGSRAEVSWSFVRETAP